MSFNFNPFFGFNLCLYRICLFFFFFFRSFPFVDWSRVLNQLFGCFLFYFYLSPFLFRGFPPPIFRKFGINYKWEKSNTSMPWHMINSFELVLFTTWSKISRVRGCRTVCGLCVKVFLCKKKVSWLSNCGQLSFRQNYQPKVHLKVLWKVSKVSRQKWVCAGGHRPGNKFI